MLLDLRHLHIRLQAALRARRLRRLVYVAKLGGGEDSVSGVTSARAHLV
jgi:hypothetical protein